MPTPNPLPPSSNVVLIIGCSSGIGRALAAEFNRQGLTSELAYQLTKL